MEIATQESIRLLMQACENPGPVRQTAREAGPAPAATQNHRVAQASAKPVSRGRKVRCRCGRCRQCVEDARWERIFVEKFADPNYYTDPVTRGGSSLTSF